MDGITFILFIILLLICGYLGGISKENKIKREYKLIKHDDWCRIKEIFENYLRNEYCDRELQDIYRRTNTNLKNK